MGKALPISEVKKELHTLRAMCKRLEIKKEQLKEFEVIKKQNKKLSEYNEELKTRLLSIVEVLEHVLPHPTRVEESMNLLDVDTYTNYLKIVSYMFEKELSMITTYTIGRYILTSINYREVETLLFNLDKLGLINLKSGEKYLEMTLTYKRVKTFQTNGQVKE